MRRYEQAQLLSIMCDWTKTAKDFSFFRWTGDWAKYDSQWMHWFLNECTPHTGHDPKCLDCCAARIRFFGKLSLVSKLGQRLVTVN